MLQLLVYSVLARQSSRSTYLIWAAVLVLVAASFQVSTVPGLLGTVTAIDGVLFLALLGLSLWHQRPHQPERDREGRRDGGRESATV
jgi:membrane protein implicated in regulation of membrane protease activity